MRSSKSRSRNKSNRNNRGNNSAGNVVNRVFDSSGPEGKVRGTPQQIIEKYNQLARDAQLSNDRVAAENFQQHAEHYLRLLGSAQKEIDQRREQQERENSARQAERDRERPQMHNDAQGSDDSARDTAKGSAPADPAQAPQPDIGDVEGEASTLVETPESRPAPKRAARKPRRKPKADDAGASKGEEPESGTPPAPEAAAE